MMLSSSTASRHVRTCDRVWARERGRKRSIAFHSIAKCQLQYLVSMSDCICVYYTSTRISSFVYDFFHNYKQEWTWLNAFIVCHQKKRMPFNAAALHRSTNVCMDGKWENVCEWHIKKRRCINVESSRIVWELVQCMYRGYN